MKETIAGREVTEEQISKWVDEAEAGYDPAELKKRGRPGPGRPGRGTSPSQVVAVRFTSEELKQIDDRARAANISRSALIREAVLS
ncbi:MAG: ribbon-helix-helix protein, CopG family [Actinomycetaceae bacterium]|nr:ribbon-helix-helix protein, CopG family [Actinomycetaceae bacterium]